MPYRVPPPRDVPTSAEPQVDAARIEQGTVYALILLALAALAICHIKIP